MKSRYISSHFIGWTFGLMTAASFHSYHSRIIALISVIFLVLAIITADLSGPNNPVKQ